MANRKRGRQNEDYSQPSSEDEASAGPSTSRGPHGSASKRSRKEQQEEDSIANEDETMQDSDDLDCTQPELATNGSEAEVGIVEKITLVNFMCHTMLEVPLGSNVNFVIGRNGSGKSAIMTGLVVGLGGKAATTNRGSSLKGFIKKECSYAVISIKLRNRGTDAYCPEKYGRSITVERRISSDGSGSYKLKSHAGKTISSKKDELNHILDQFNIQVDNPISVLNQDTSRNFLNSSDPKDKYKFFLKATQLEQISQDYQMVMEHQDVIKNMLEHKSKMIPDIKKEVEALEHKYNETRQLKNMKEQVEELKRQRVWAEVIENEKKLPPLEREVEKQQSKLPRYQERIEGCTEQVTTLEEQSETIQQQIDVVTQEARDVTAIQTELSTHLKELKNDVRKKESEVRKVKRQLDTAKHDRQILTDRIDEIKQAALHDREAEKRGRETKLTQAREKLQASQNQLATTSHHRDQVNQAMNRARESSYSLRTEVGDARKVVDSMHRRLQNLRNSTRDRLTLFGSHMPELIQRIQGAARRARFHRTPVGPLGAHIKLRNQKWDLAVESHLKGMVFAFCCNDVHDQQILQQIMKQVCPNKDSIPQIFISRFHDEVYDVSHNKPRCAYSTVLDELVIDDPVAANCLIDQAGIESVLLIEDPKEARDVMFGSPPPGAHMAYVINGDQVFGGRSAKYYSSNHSSAKFLQQDIQQEIRRLERDLNEKQQNHRQLQEQLSQLEASLTQNKNEHKKASDKAMHEQEIVNRLVEEITELENYEEEELPDVTTLEEEVVNYNQQIAELTEQDNVLEDEFEKAKEVHHKQDLKMKRHQEKMQEVFDKHDPFKAQLQDAMCKILKAKSDKKHYEDGMKIVEDGIRKAEKAVADMKVKIEDISEMAAQYCERVETTRTVKGLESEIIQKEKCIQTEEKNKGKYEQITKQYFDAKKKYDNINESFKNLKRFHKRLAKIMKKRSEAYVDYRKFIALRAIFFFQMMLSQRGYGGKMRFDHDRESLFLEVNVEQGSKKGAKDTRSLSGGERSFSTVSFIMALWEAMESPFRCLDEFDVFMDMVNRRISMQMMLKVAKEQQQRQFILLTPQDMSAIGGGPNVRIFRLKDPERGQTTLDFEPVARDDEES